MKTLILTSALAFLALTACKQAGAPDPHFGEAVNHNILVQTVDPDAPKDKGPIAYNGAVQMGAQTRYETGKVKQPSDMSTSTVMVGGGGGSK